MVWKSFVFLLLFGAGAHAVEERRSVAVRAGYARASSSLTGDGFNADLPSRSSFLYGFDVSYRRPGETTGYELRYDRTSASVTAPSNLTPRDLAVFREDLAILASNEPWKAGELATVRLKIGYGLSKSGATATAPYEIMTTRKIHCALLGVASASELGERWSLLTDLQLSLPFSISESDQVTGHSPSMFGIDARVAAEYAFSESFAGFIGIGYRDDRASFEGAVSRGVTGGRDVRTLFTIPVGVRFGY